MKKVGIEDVPPLNDWPELFGWFKRQNKLVQVEYFDTPEPGFSDEAFAVGRITGLSSRSVAVMNFDPSGNCDSEATVIESSTELVKVRGRQAHLLGMLNDSASVNAVDPAAVVGGERERN